jgi:NADH-quinone oxidoreductase subunit J
MLIKILFLVFWILALVSALGILLTKNVLYAAFWFLLTLLSVAALFVFAGADFLAVAQVVMYVGGVLVLLLFGVMLSSPARQRLSVGIVSQNRSQVAGIGLALGIFLLLLWALRDANLTVFDNPATEMPSSTVTVLGIQLMSTTLLPFEVVGLLLLLVLVGAAWVASPSPFSENKKDE